MRQSTLHSEAVDVLRILELARLLSAQGELFTTQALSVILEPSLSGSCESRRELGVTHPDIHRCLKPEPQSRVRTHNPLETCKFIVQANSFVRFSAASPKLGRIVHFNAANLSVCLAPDGPLRRCWK